MTTAPFLAALAQVEASGNPVARNYWRWSWRPHFFELYRPASSAVGMYQITDGTFAEARHLCIHEHRVVREGPWNDWHSCWMNDLYSRVIPAMRWSWSPPTSLTIPMNCWRATTATTRRCSSARIWPR